MSTAILNFEIRCSSTEYKSLLPRKARRQDCVYAAFLELDVKLHCWFVL